MFKQKHVLITTEFTMIIAIRCHQLGIDLNWMDNGEDFPTVATYTCSDRKFRKLHKFMMKNEEFGGINLGITF